MIFILLYAFRNLAKNKSDKKAQSKTLHEGSKTPGNPLQAKIYRKYFLAKNSYADLLHNCYMEIVYDSQRKCTKAPNDTP